MPSIYWPHSPQKCSHGVCTHEPTEHMSYLHETMSSDKFQHTKAVLHYHKIVRARACEDARARVCADLDAHTRASEEYDCVSP